MTSEHQNNDLPSDDREGESIEESREKKRDYLLPSSITIAAIIIAFAWIYTTGLKATPQIKNQTAAIQNESTGETLTIPLAWSDLGSRMIEAGVIDQRAFEAVYAQRGGLAPKEKELLNGQTNNAITVSQENAGFILNFLWAFGLGNKNPILESGPMADPHYGGSGNFASTGGWTISNGNVMNHYSAHSFVALTKEQQELVERVSKNIYRPCCDNATYFPDCNHGMAILGLLELLAAQNTSEATMYKVALQMNRFWFPDQYSAIAQYLQNDGRIIESADPKEVLGRNYSSASGYRGILQAVGPQAPKGGVNCDVGGGSAAPTQSSGSGCGI